MSQNRRRCNLQIVGLGQTEAFTFQGLRFSRTEPTDPDGCAYNRVEGGAEHDVFTWTPAQEATRSSERAAGAKSDAKLGADGPHDAHRRLKRVIP